MSIVTKIQIGKLVYSNVAYRHDIMFGTVPAKHLFWRFWWSTKY